MEAVARAHHRCVEQIERPRCRPPPVSPPRAPCPPHRASSGARRSRRPRAGLRRCPRSPRTPRCADNRTRRTARDARAAGRDCGTTKYTHHMPNVRPVPATATRTASRSSPCSETTADSDATVPTTPSPSAMIVSSAIALGDVMGVPWRSAHPGLGEPRPEHLERDQQRRPTRSVTDRRTAAKIVAIQPICATVTTVA